MSSVSFFRDAAYPISEQRDMSISELERKLDLGEMTVPDYQRNYVWTKKQQQGYLRSISQGFPLFGPVINLDMDTNKHEIMDGRNRIYTIYMFLKDKISYEEDEKDFKFSELPDNQKRRFRNKRVSYLETQSWTEEDCQDFFVTMNGGGVTLKSGELIHADKANIFTKEITTLSDEYKVFLSSSAKKEGIGMTKAQLKRYQHYEFLGTIFHMVRTSEFPLRPGETAKDEMEIWRSKEKDDTFRHTMDTVRKLMDKYKVHVGRVPRLREKLLLSNHLRLLYFLFKQQYHIQELDDDHFARIDRILNTVLNKGSTDYTDIISWGTTECMKIYKKYEQLYTQ